jgi:hypothetical protein
LKLSGHLERSAFQTPAPSISPFLCFYPFADGGILHWQRTHRIWVLNASSAYLWCLLEEVASTEELASHLAARFAIDHETAMRDVTLTLAAFAQEGLLGEEPPPRLQDETNFWAGGYPAGPVLPEPLQWAIRELLCLPGQTVEFCCQDYSMGAEFMALVAHLKSPEAAPPEMRLAVLADARSAGTWAIYLNDRLFLDGLAFSEVLPHLFTLLFVKVSEALSASLLFHAAVIGRQEQAVMFPAEAGSGKTTLVAALAARGHLFFSDELAVLEPRELKLLPMPMPMSVKPGSTASLERYYPGLSAQPIHPRADGQSVRYLIPPPEALTSSHRSGATIEAIVFPRYRAGVKTSLVTLDKISALQRLVQTGSSDRELVEADVEALIDSVEQRPCYTLEYSDLPEVIELLEGTFACLSKAFPSR